MELVYSLPAIDDAARWVLKAVGHRRVLLLDGQMGAGKTTLIQAICRQLGVDGGMSSPTFSIINEYGSAAGGIFHVDLYRCQSEQEVIRAGVEECIYSGNFCFVEWPSKAPDLFPDDAVSVQVVQLDEQTRKIVVNCKQ